MRSAGLICRTVTRDEKIRRENSKKLLTKYDRSCNIYFAADKKQQTSTLTTEQ